MNPIESLHELIHITYPDAAVSLAPPLRTNGVWSMDVDLGDKCLAIEWRRTGGFGITSVNRETFGEGPDEVFETVEAAKGRVDQLLTTAEVTTPPLALLLPRLRERRGLTQQELAAKMGIKQASISGIERRNDLQLSTLRRVVEALGGALEVLALFSDAKYRINVPNSESSTAPSTSGVPTRDQDGASSTAKHEFEGLRKAGILDQAFAAANAISARRSVIEFI